LCLPLLCLRLRVPPHVLTTSLSYFTFFQALVVPTGVHSKQLAFSLAASRSTTFVSTQHYFGVRYLLATLFIFDQLATNWHQYVFCRIPLYRGLAVFNYSSGLLFWIVFAHRFLLRHVFNLLDIHLSAVPSSKAFQPPIIPLKRGWLSNSAYFDLALFKLCLCRRVSDSKIKRKFLLRVIRSFVLFVSFPPSAFATPGHVVLDNFSSDTVRSIVFACLFVVLRLRTHGRLPSNGVCASRLVLFICPRACPQVDSFCFCGTCPVAFTRHISRRFLIWVVCFPFVRFFVRH